MIACKPSLLMKTMRHRLFFMNPSIDSSSNYHDKEISNYIHLIRQIENSKYYFLLKLLRIKKPHKDAALLESEDPSIRLAHLENYYNQLTLSNSFAWWQGYNEIKKLFFSIWKKPYLVKKYLLILFKVGPVGLLRKVKSIFKNKQFHISLKKDYAIWVKENFPSDLELKNQRNQAKSFKLRPRISIIIPTYNTKPEFLKDCLDSVLAQSYDNWELCIADDNSSDAETVNIIKNYARIDRRIKYRLRSKNGHICQASNSALSLATGQYVSLLDHDDFLWPNALFEIVKKINQAPNAGLIYSDEDKLEEYTDIHTDPFFKPAFNFDYLRSINYITHFSTFRKDVVDKIGGFRSGFEGSQDWDLILRATRLIESDRRYTIEHIPSVIYSWRKSATSTASERYSDTVKSYAYMNQHKTLMKDLADRGMDGEVLKTKYLGLWRVKYHIKQQPVISIIIPSKNNFRLLKNSIESLKKNTKYKNYEIIIVDNDSSDKNVLEYYNQIEDAETKIINFSEPFNFSKICNFGAEASRGDYLLFLNNDTEIIEKEWLHNLLEHAQRDDVGVVGSKLLYSNHTIQSMGIVLVENDYKNNVYVAIHPGKGMNDEAVQGFPAIHYKDAVREVSAVSAACCMIKTSVFKQVGGFDEELPVAYNDVDFCLRVNKEGLRNIYTPYAPVIHYESATLGNVESNRRDKKRLKLDIEYFVNKHGILKDKFLNPHITHNKEDFSLSL